MSSSSKKNHFRFWLTVYLLILVIQATSFLCSFYFLAENIRNGNRWIAFGSIVLLNLFSLAAIHFLNRKMSVGTLGSSMQALRTSRFTGAFLNVALASLVSTALVYLIDDDFYPTLATTPYGPLAASLVFLGGILEFIFTYYLFQGQGITRL